MRTIFSRFENYDDADEAVKALQGKNVAQDAINVLVNAQLAKANLDDVNLARVHVDVTDAVGEQELTGLALLIANEQAVNVPTIGPVLASGQLATTIVGAALPSQRAGEDLQTVLENFGLPDETAARYCTALSAGGIVILVKTVDDQATTVGEVFRRHNGKDVKTNQN